MLLQINPKKPHQQTPSQLIATSSLSSYWDKPHEYLQKAKQKKAVPEDYFVWFHATMLFSGLFSWLLLICGLLICELFSGLFGGLLLNLLANKFQGNTFTVHDSGCKGFRAVRVAVFFRIPDNIAFLVLRSNVGGKWQNHSLSNS